MLADQTNLRPVRYKEARDAAASRASHFRLFPPSTQPRRRPNSRHQTYNRNPITPTSDAQRNTGDDLFKAAIGGIGAAGIISEVTVQAVERFNVEQRVYLADVRNVERELDALLHSNEHFSLYLFPFTNKCQVNIWNRTPRRRSRFGRLREFIAISVDALLAAWLGNLFAYIRILPWISTLSHSLKRGTNLVLESNQAYSRTIYHLHQELEFTVPVDETFKRCREFVGLYEEMYRSGVRLPYALFEVRFTPKGHDLTFIGAGRERRCTWIDLVCNDSSGFESYYARAEELMKAVGARPHLGKYCESFDSSDMHTLHGASFESFREVVRRHDPEGRFVNDFTRRLFGL